MKSIWNREVNTEFRFVEYGKNKYPDEIKSELVEIAGHLDKENIEDAPHNSIHTEYSYGKRALSSVLVRNYPELCDANRDDVPQLWKSIEWANAKADWYDPTIDAEDPLLGKRKRNISREHDDLSEYTKKKPYSIWEDDDIPDIDW